MMFYALHRVYRPLDYRTLRDQENHRSVFLNALKRKGHEADREHKWIKKCQCESRVYTAEHFDTHLIKEAETNG